MNIIYTQKFFKHLYTEIQLMFKEFLKMKKINSYFQLKVTLNNEKRFSPFKRKLF